MKQENGSKNRTIKRKAKKDIIKGDLMDEVMDDLGFDKFPISPCIVKGRTYAFMNSCLKRCTIICNDFRLFNFVTQQCDNIDCTDKHPCRRCFDRMQDVKFLMMIYKALYGHRSKGAKVKLGRGGFWNEYTVDDG